MCSKKMCCFCFSKLFLKKHHILILYNQSIYSNLPTGPTSPGPHPPRLTSAEAQAIRQRLRVRLGAAVTSQRWRGWHHNGGQWLHTIRGWVFTCHDAWWFLNVVVFFGGSPWFVLFDECLFVCFCWRFLWCFVVVSSWTLLEVFLGGMLGMLAGCVWCVLHCFVDYFVWVCVCSDAGSCRLKQMATLSDTYGCIIQFRHDWKWQ